jgi:hypothetical protein
MRKALDYGRVSTICSDAAKKVYTLGSSRTMFS